ncbi:MAG: hypothetical protein O7I93_08045 [Gemmatimonadetes bacterium]|nr:hypothetical protein [Gemmatimonadota bacterium]
MKPTVAVVSPGYPENPGGVTDHTKRLVAHWTSEGHRVEIVNGTTDSAPAIADRLARLETAALLIQYVPFLYGRRGLSRFPESVARHAKARDIRVTTFVHEPWVPPTRVPWLVLSPLQRRQLRRLVSVTDEVVTAVPTWRDMLGPTAELVYVGSTLESVAPSKTPHQPITSPVVFSPLASGLRWDWIEAAVRAIGAEPGLIAVGADDDAVSRAEHVKRWYRPEWRWLGHLPSTEVRSILERAPLVLAPFVDGTTGRRTSLLSAQSAGARVMAATGHLHDPMFDSGPIHVAASLQEFARMAKAVWHSTDSADERGRRLQWYAEHFDPVMLDRTLLGILMRGRREGR